MSGEGARGRSWTDLLSNEAYLHILDVLVEPNDVLEGRVPLAAIPELLHESAHHTCLSGSVGLALAVLDRDAQRQLTSGDSTAAVRSILAISVVLEAYRPVLEGVALLAEFDALPGESQILSRPSWWTLDLCLRGQLSDSDIDRDDWQSYLAFALMDSRMTLESFSRRMRVLSTSFRDPGAYLLGYLYVKSWRRLVAREHPAFRDIDFTVFFLSDYFFDDYSLAALLLDPDVRLGEIEDYALRRLADLYAKQDWQTMAARFEHAMLHYDPDTESLSEFVLAPSGIDGPHAARGREVLSAAIRSLEPSDQAFIARRTLMHLVSLPVEIQIENQVAMGFLDGRAVLAVQIDDAVETTGGPGSLDLFIETSTKSSCAALTANGQIVRLVSRGNSAYIDRWARQFDLARTGRSTSALDALTAQLPAVGLSHRSLVDGVAARRLNIVAPRALAALGRIETIQSLVMQPAGFRSLLGRRSTKALALLSATEGVAGYLEEITITDEEFDVASEAEILNDKLHAAGLPRIALIEVTDEDGRPRRDPRSWV